MSENWLSSCENLICSNSSNENNLSSNENNLSSNESNSSSTDLSLLEFDMSEPGKFYNEFWDPSDKPKETFTFESIKNNVQEKIDANVIFFHGGLSQDAFIRVPDNFLIIQSGRDDRYIRRFPFFYTNTKFKYTTFTYFLVSLWILHIHIVLKKCVPNGPERLLQCILDNNKTYDKIRQKLIDYIYDKLLSDYMNENVEIGQEIYYYKPGDIIPDIIFNDKNKDELFATGMTDVFTFHDKHYKVITAENQDEEFKKCEYRFSNGSELESVTELRRCKNTLSNIINEIIEKKKMSQTPHKITVLFIKTCLGIENNILKHKILDSGKGQILEKSCDILRLRREKSFMYRNFRELVIKKQTLFGEIEIDTKRVSEKQNKYIKIIKPEKEFKNFFRQIKNIYTQKIFTDDEKKLSKILFSVFCLGENEFHGGSFIYYDDLEQQHLEQRYNGKNLLGIRFPYRDTSGQFSTSFISNYSTFPPLPSQLYIPDNKQGEILLNSFKKSPIDIEFGRYVIDNIGIDRNKLEFLLNSWCNYFNTQFVEFNKYFFRLISQKISTPEESNELKRLFDASYGPTGFEYYFDCRKKIFDMLYLGPANKQIQIKKYFDKNEPLVKKINGDNPFLCAHFIEYLIANVNYTHIIKKKFTVKDISTQEYTLDETWKNENFSGSYHKHRNLYMPLQKHFSEYLEENEPIEFFFHRYAKIYMLSSQFIYDEKTKPKNVTTFPSIEILILNYIINEEMPTERSAGPPVNINLLLEDRHLPVSRPPGEPLPFAQSPLPKKQIQPPPPKPVQKQPPKPVQKQPPKPVQKQPPKPVKSSPNYNSDSSDSDTFGLNENEKFNLKPVSYTTVPRLKSLPQSQHKYPPLKKRKKNNI
jgi:hypothetical protein